MEFTTRKGRIQATKNMVSLGISNLVVIGGDGSLTGANIFRLEWPSYVKELLSKGVVWSYYCYLPTCSLGFSELNSNITYRRRDIVGSFEIGPFELGRYRGVDRQWFQWHRHDDWSGFRSAPYSRRHRFDREHCVFPPENVYYGNYGPNLRVSSVQNKRNVMHTRAKYQFNLPEYITWYPCLDI